ncbi:HprK-related kinase B [Marinomonas transparens]|uniref:HprK-related kinase B n=1 Tax=Marinomonas transparens TaxID=2795388 RepID=A0A934JLX0_9GAMM|nr:HprK-related kinase B [Marinomonas transparens]MBJ7538590.1 HprK-related kinase B [Marinomonas transparens]
MITNLLDTRQLKVEMSNCQFRSRLVFGSLRVDVYTNNMDILTELGDYYKSYVEDTAIEQTISVYIIDQPAVEDDLDWLEVPREAGKQGRKEGYLESASGRWIKKFKTNMLMLQRQRDPIVVGPCLDNLAQVINFINNQFINVHLRRDWVLGHASGFSVAGQVTAIAAGSGGGKSTLMLRCLEDASRQFLTNDRLLMEATSEGVKAVGVAKLPRVNPGTLLHSHNDRLKHILPLNEQEKLSQLAQQALWELEQKYDVQIEDEYGENRVQLQGELKNLIMLDWSLASSEPTCLTLVDLEKEPDTIEGLRKRPGPFYQDKVGVFSDSNDCPSVAEYCQMLKTVRVFKLTGAIDFDVAFELIKGMDQL